MTTEGTSHPTTFVIFGATGDLVQKKLAPALLNLFTKGLLPPTFQIIGFSRRDWSHEQFREYLRGLLRGERLEDFLSHVFFYGGNLDDAAAYDGLAKFLHERDGRKNVCSNKLYYLAVPPTHYKGIFEKLSASGLTIPCIPGPTALETVWTRVLVEKPFGNNLEEAQELDRLLATLYKEEQIFRIDHYLGKQSLQDILTFRFKDGAYEKFWNKDYIEKIELRFLEDSLVGTRGEFYDHVGALADVGQNHLLQMLALVTMEAPANLESEDIRVSRAGVLEAVHVPKDAEFARGQYEGYKNEEGVKPGSTTETYFKVTVAVDSIRWQGVPITIESGKGFAKNVVDITVSFKDREPITFSIDDKPGMNAYERVLGDCIVGDQMIFTTTREVEAEWKLVNQIREAWKDSPVTTYEIGKLIH